MCCSPSAAINRTERAAFAMIFVREFDGSVLPLYLHFNLAFILYKDDARSAEVRLYRIMDTYTRYQSSSAISYL